MQFTYAALAVLATTVLADTTVFMTEEVTITSCGPTVTDCPARSTVVSLTSYPVVTGTGSPEGPITKTVDETVISTILSCAPTVTDCPVGSVTTIITPGTTAPAVPGTPSNGTSYAVPAPPASKPVTVAPPAVTSESSPELPVVTVTVTFCPAPEAPTTLVPAVPTAPVVVPSGTVPTGPAGPPFVPTGTGVAPPYSPSGTGAPGPPANGTGVTTATPPKFTSGAAALTGSVAAFAGLVAVLFI